MLKMRGLTKKIADLFGGKRKTSYTLQCKLKATTIIW